MHLEVQSAGPTTGDQIVLSPPWISSKPAHSAIWYDSLMIPSYIVLLSISIHLIGLAKSSRAYKVLRSRAFDTLSSQNEDDSDERGAQPWSLVDKIRQRVTDHGNLPTFVGQVVQVLGCVALLCLSITSAIVNESKPSQGLFKIWEGNNRFSLSDDEWLGLAMCSFYLYTTMLAVAGVASTSRKISWHLTALLLTAFGVYFYRDLFPLATYTWMPLDANEGWLLWAKIAILFLVSIVIPLGIPRPYIPIDANHPVDPSSEQTASLFSLITYSFLDPLVWFAYRVPKLDNADLPSLADYDHASVLKSQSFPHLDPFTGASKRHLFFGFMRVFFWEYLGMATMIVIHVNAAFAAPLAINRILRHMETGGDGAFMKPWAWILLLFLGPTVVSVAFQAYIYLGTWTLVRVEGIITQLVFEHALRIRIKASTAPSGSSASGTTTPIERPATPDNAPLESQHDNEETLTDGRLGEGTHSREETLRDSSASVDSGRSAKGKALKKSLSTSNDGQSTRGMESAQPNESDKNLVGKINNLVTADLANIGRSRDFLMAFLFVPFQIVLCIAFLYAVLGWSAFVGLATIIILFPVPGYIAKLVQTVQTARMKKSDARVQSITEVMNVIRMIKLFGWEKKMHERVAEKREEELTWIKKKLLLDLANATINFLIPVFTMMTTYGTYVSLSTILPSLQLNIVIMKQQLNASTVFSSMAVFEMLRDQLNVVVHFVTVCIAGKVSLDRINDFLHNTELLDSYSADETPAIFSEEVDSHADTIGFKNATFAWTSEPIDGTLTPSKRNFLFRVEDEVIFKQGCVSIIVGPTGSGKTSLLMALLGEMHYIPSAPDSWYNLPRSGGIAYAAQESWVQNETIRDNILFGSPYDEDRYKKVIHQCALETDLQLFDAGDQTEVGEKGLTLSGGQKARVTLARAVYSQAQTLLLDDVLAALDVHTAKWIIDKCFNGDLIKGRTVLLVTHNVALALPIADYIISLNIEGRIVSAGPISEEIAKDHALVEEVKEEQAALNKHTSEVDPPAPGTESKTDGKLIVAEEVETGHVSWKALKLHFGALGGSHPIIFFTVVVGGLALTEILNTLETWYLGYWARQYELSPPEEVDVFHYLGFYSILLLISSITFSAAFVMYIFGALRASRKLHQKLVDAVLGTTLRWLDTTPVSRIITRCTQDILTVDGDLANTLWWLSEMTATMLSKFVAVLIFTPVFLVPGLLVAAIGGWVGQIYIAAQLAVKREMSNAKAPVVGHFGAAISGLTSIRAYGAESRFIEESFTRINRYTRAGRTFYNLNRWVCIRIDFVGSFFASTLAVYLVYFQNQSASNTGFSLNMAVGFSGMILWWVRLLNEFEVEGNSLERIQGYISIEQEPKATTSGEPPAYWPASGEIRAEKLTARYSADGPEVLHDLTFQINSGERIGVVGRTGSGKSSLTLSLLRCIFTGGDVYYDGLKTSAVNLDALRSKITIIPQVPELLSGSLRYNLDPFDQYDDATLNDSLRAAGLFNLQSELDENRITLDSAISSGGGNLSVGQRQILALARAIVRGSKLLILDEATSAIDFKTDSVIQSSLRNELKGDVTLITIAHRLQTIMDADRIMVLDAGRIVEFDSPKNLLKNDQGRLRALVDESGDRAALYNMAGL